MFHMPRAMGTRTPLCRGKAHYIEVFSDSEGEEDTYEEVEGEANAEASRGDHPPPPPPGARGATFAPTRGVLTSLLGVPKYLTLRV